MRSVRAAFVTFSAASAVLAAATAAPVPALAGDDFHNWTCEDLWTQRNSIFQNGGYCFQSPRAIKKFGNAGCLYDSEAAVPLSDYARAEIRQIKAAERAKGC